MKKIFNILILSFFLCATVVSAKNPSGKDNPYPKFTRADSLHGTLMPSRACYDVRFYDISVDVFPETKSIVGEVSMDFLYVDSTQKVMQIDLASRLKIDDIAIDGVVIENYTREYNAVFIILPEIFSVTNEHRLTCRYGGTPVEAVRPPWEGGMVWKTSPSGKPWCGVTCETLGASCWIPCKDHLSDEPEQGMRMRISTPEGLTAVSNGSFVSHETVENRELWTWQTNYPINSYNMTFYIGDFIHFGEEYQGVEAKFPLNYYVFAEDEEKARVSFEQAKDVISFYEEVYGPYPWANEGYKLIESPYEGMEHQTAIAYGNGFKNFKGLPMDYIIVHETAHEWWGNAISVDDYADVFIHEGFAMYSEFLYVERKFGQDTAQMYADMWQCTISNIRPVVGPRDVNFWDYHDIDPYVKGAWCLKGLRHLLDNDTLFFDIVKSYYQSRKYTVVTVKDFTDFVNEKTGKDYLWYFNHYLYRAEAPTLELAVIPTKKLHKYKYPIKNMSSDTGGQFGNEVLYLYCRWTNVEDNFVMPVVVSNPSQPKETKILPITTEGGIFVLDNKVWSLNQDFYFDMKQLKKVKTK